MTASTMIVRRRVGHHAAEAWYADFQSRGEQADGYFFPSGLREAFADLPQAEKCHFLDSVGALLVMWLVSGEPAPGHVNTAEEIHTQALSPQEQDAQCGEAEDE